MEKITIFFNSFSTNHLYFNTIGINSRTKKYLFSKSVRAITSQSGKITLENPVYQEEIYKVQFWKSGVENGVMKIRLEEAAGIIGILAVLVKFFDLLFNIEN